MKKIISLLLVFIMLLCLTACSDSQGDSVTTTEAAASNTGFSVGYARENITPTTSGDIFLAGYEDDTPCIGVMDPLYVSCIAITDENNNTALLFSFDLGSVSIPFSTEIRNKVTSVTGVPKENIFSASTHIHSAPAHGDAVIHNLAVNGAAKTAQAAMESRKPAEIFIGRSETENLNFVRHYVMDDGSFVGDNYGIVTGKAYVKHETEADNEIQLIKFVRDGEKDIVLMNWQGHPTVTGNNGYITSDTIGYCRMYMENTFDCDFVYFQGASGNLNTWSRISDENISATRDVKKHGEALGRYAGKGLDNMTKVNPGEIKIKSVTYKGEVRKTTGEENAAAAVFLSIYEETKDQEKACAATNGLINSIFTISGMKNRAAAGDYKNLPLNMIAIGDISFITAPYEMFDTNGMYIKENTPFEMTFVVTYCNGHESYIPSQLGFDNGCYEKDNGYFVAGTGEKLAELYVETLNELHD